MTILQTIAKAHYVATEAQVEQLAAAHYGSSAEVERTNTTYLRVLIAGVQAKVGTKTRGRKPSPEAFMSVLEEVHNRFYAAVLKGVDTPDIAVGNGELAPAERTRRILERNRRSNFARSAKATVALFVEAGGDVRALDVENTTKAQLRSVVQPPEPQDRVTRVLSRAQASILRIVERTAKQDRSRAVELLRDVILALQTRLTELGPVPIPIPVKARGSPKGRKPERTTVGEVTFRGAQP